MLGKRGGCCRTDGPRRVRSCQIMHAIATINPAWCRSLRWASSPRASDSATCTKFNTAYIKRWILYRSRTGAEHTIPSVYLHISDAMSARQLEVLSNPPCNRRLLCCCCTNSGLCPACGAIGLCRGVLSRTNVRCVLGQWNRENLPQLYIKCYLR